MQLTHTNTANMNRVILLSVLFVSNIISIVETKPERYAVDVNTKVPLRKVNERYLSVALGASLIWHRWKTWDFKSVRLNTLSRALSPAYLRLGGTWADFLLFDPNGKKEPYTKEQLQNLYKDPNYWHSFDTYGLQKPISISNFTMTGEDWEQINNFAINVGWKFFFDFNVLLRKNGQWDPTQAIEILDYSIKKGFTQNQNFELGNEPDSFPWALNRTLLPTELGQDFLTFYKIIQGSKYKKYFEKSLLVGDDTAHPSNSRYLEIFLEKAGSVLNAVTFHQYYMGKRSATQEKFMDPLTMDMLVEQIAIAKFIVGTVMPKDTKLWLGETGSAYDGGAPNLSDRYVAGFLWMDKLGLGARLGLDLIMRQTYYGGNYAMIDNDLYPLPDYWLSLLHKVLVGTKVLNVTVADSRRKLRLYAHCTNVQRSGYPEGSITIFGLNVHSEAVNVTLSQHVQNQAVDVYLMTPFGNDLTSQYVNLNGKKLEMVDDKTLPHVQPLHLPPGEDLYFPAQTFGFFVLSKAKASACLERVNSVFPANYSPRHAGIYL